MPKPTTEDDDLVLSSRYNLRSPKHKEIHFIICTKPKMRCVAAKELASSKSADEIERCYRLPVARAFLSLPLPLARRADRLAAHFCYDLAQTYQRSVLTRSLQYPNVHTPGKISRFESSVVVASVNFD